ncbi:MAG: 1,4-alpha-glucan branching protein GlgB [Oscillospiraceae bacterium]|nr:1,4-alpha-glucan branching protein GlgB [Oscillospiraceae bacterium]
MKKKKITTHFNAADMQNFCGGISSNAYEMLGARKAEIKGISGYLFGVWAPNAASVSVVGDFNNWTRDDGVMHKHDEFGIWEAFIPNVEVGQCYKFSIELWNGDIVLKADPYAQYSELRPKTASVINDSSFRWSDGVYMNKRRKTPPYDQPISIYELHFGSFKQTDDGEFLTYSQMADELIPHVKRMGFTHIEIMPISEYPFDGSWGYQVIGYFSVNSRYGTPAEFKEFVNRCHKAGIGVIMDWVPAHFPKDDNGLRLFDGTAIYEYPDSARGEHKEWGTLVFDYGRGEVRSFLISNAMYWLKEFHLDGLRVDAVSSMLYLDYNRRDGEWLPNIYGGKENLEAIDFLKTLNTAVFAEFPNALMIAEESTSWGGVTLPVEFGGLGFNFKWNMGWMNDTLKYMSMDPYFRSFNHNLITFSMMYAFSENYVLALSHDEVVHGKRSLIEKMSGTYEQKFAALRALYAYMYAHPGKKLLFMGGEFAQFIEWRYYEGLEWGLLEFDMHRMMQTYVADLNKLYASTKALYQNDFDWEGFSWINAGDNERSIISFIRHSKSKREKIVVVGNFTPVSYEKYTIGVPAAGEYEVILSTDDAIYGGSGEFEGRTYKAMPAYIGNFPYYLEIDVPPLAVMYLRKMPR